MNLIPEGTWKCRGVSYALGYTSQDGEQVGVEIMLLPDQHEDVDGRHLTWYGQFSEKAEPFTLKALRTLGWQGDDIADLSGVIDGPECEAVIGHEQDLQGEWRHRVRFIQAVGAGGVAMKSKMTEDQARAFAERMRGRVLAANRKAPAAPPAASNAAPKPSSAPKPAAASKPPAKQRKAAAAEQPPESDDIPF
jgi:hypothetical protein